jgi:hypothetical protein
MALQRAAWACSAATQLVKCLAGCGVPAAIPVVGPGVADVAAFEAPLQPAQLVMGKVLEQLDGVQPDGSRLRRISSLGKASSLLTSRDRK